MKTYIQKVKFLDIVNVEFSVVWSKCDTDLKSLAKEVLKTNGHTNLGQLAASAFDKYLARACAVWKDRCVCLFIPMRDRSMLAHELDHAAKAICGFNGIPLDSEAATLIFQYIYDLAIDWMFPVNRKTKPKGKRK